MGSILDKIGVKWIMRVGSVIWSIASFMTALVSGFGLIILSRVLLGIGESLAWLVATATDIVIGGVLVDRLITRGSDPTRVRKTLFTIGMLLGIAAICTAPKFLYTHLMDTSESLQRAAAVLAIGFRTQPV